MSLDLIEGGAGSRKRCKSYQKRSKKTGHCRNVGSKSRRSGMMTRAMTRRMRGGEIEGGEVEGGEVEGGDGTRKKCKRGKTRRGTGVCHKPKSKKSRSPKSKKSRSRRSCRS